MLLRERQCNSRKGYLLALAFLATFLLAAFQIPYDSNTYVSHDETVRDFVTARPAALSDRCYEETTGTALCATGQKCIETGRTPWWDAKRGAYHVIPMKALHTSVCTSVCCPANPPVGTCYKKWALSDCAEGYTRPFSSLLSGSLCCVPGSCFWFRTSLTKCDCPARFNAVDRTDSCSAGGWALCCPINTNLGTMQLSAQPFESLPPPAWKTPPAPPPSLKFQTATPAVKTIVPAADANTNTKPTTSTNNSEK